jgi:MFS family permease
MRQSIHTTEFWLLCLSNFLFTASFNMLLPELPSYLAQMGGQKHVGLIIALFTLTAGLSRPFSGKLTDTLGRVPIMALGSIVCFICGFIYPMITTVSGLLILRFFHGFSTGTKPTATAAYIADITPIQNRGEAAGTLGIFTAIGMSIAPVIGGLLSSTWGINATFYCSSIFALLSIVILIKLKETLPPAQKEKLSLNSLKVKWVDVFEKKVLIVFLVMFFLSWAYGAWLTMIADQTVHVGLKNKGFFYTINTLSALTVRILFAKTSDKYGRSIVMKFTCMSMVISMLILAYAHSIWALSIATVLFGVASGMGTPTLTAWAIDLSDEAYRGRALATMYIGLEAGIGLGAYLSGLIYQGNVNNLYIAYLIAMGSAILSLISLFVFHPRETSRL